MDIRLSAIGLAKGFAEKPVGFSTGANPLDKSLQPAYGQLLCPTVYTRAWLTEKQLYTQIKGVPNGVALLPLAWEEWLGARYPGLPLAEQCDALRTEGFQPSEVLVGVYFALQMPVMLQEALAPWATEWVAVDPDVAHFSAAMEKRLVVTDKPGDEDMVLHHIADLLDQGVVLSDILMVCPNHAIKRQWQERCWVFELPVWGCPADKVLIEAAAFEALLSLCAVLPAGNTGELSEVLVSVPQSWSAVKALCTCLGVSGLAHANAWHVLASYPTMQPWIQLIALLWQALGNGLSPREALQYAIKHQGFAAFSAPFQQGVLRFMGRMAEPSLPEAVSFLTLKACWGQWREALFFDPSRQGIRLLTLAEAKGILVPHVILPNVEAYFQTQLAEADWADLEAILSYAPSILATYDPTIALDENSQAAEDWLKTWRLHTVPQSGVRSKARNELKEAFWMYQVPQNSAAPVFSETPTITLSPSSIALYLQCPRKFFYQTLLNLYEDTTSPQAALGILIHRILEVFNRQYKADYTLAQLNAIVEQLFSAETPWQILAERGFQKSDRQLLLALPMLQRQYVKHQVLQSFLDLAGKGYFHQPFQTLREETVLTAHAIPELPGVVLKGRADLIRELPDGALEIVDYKTSRQSFLAARLETNMQPLLNALAPVDWEELDPHQRYGDRYYQLPLYWLMTRYIPEFQNRKTHVAIQMVRPMGASGKNGGCQTFRLTHEQLLEAQESLLALLKQGIADPLRASTDFMPLGHPQQHCPACAYRHMCQRNTQNMEENMGLPVS